MLWQQKHWTRGLVEIVWGQPQENVRVLWVCDWILTDNCKQTECSSLKRIGFIYSSSMKLIDYQYKGDINWLVWLINRNDRHLKKVGFWDIPIWKEVNCIWKKLYLEKLTIDCRHLSFRSIWKFVGQKKLLLGLNRSNFIDIGCIGTMLHVFKVCLLNSCCLGSKNFFPLIGLLKILERIGTASLSLYCWCDRNEQMIAINVMINVLVQSLNTDNQNILFMWKPESIAISQSILNYRNLCAICLDPNRLFNNFIFMAQCNSTEYPEIVLLTNH